VSRVKNNGRTSARVFLHSAAGNQRTGGDLAPGSPPVGLRGNMTIDEQFAEARSGVIDAVALFLAAESEERTSAFLNFWNDRLEREIVALSPADRSFFIWKLIDATMVRMRELERDAVRGSRLLH
jgi:hypothetical protein